MLVALLLKWGIPSWLAKVLEVLVLLSAIALSYYLADLHGKELQKGADDKVIAVYKQQLADANIAYSESLNKLQIQQTADLTIEKQKSADIEAEKQTVLAQLAKEKQNHAISKRADQAAVTGNVFTAGFVREYNLPISSEVPGISTSEPANADAPTGLDTSTVDAVASANNAECVARGQVLAQWQAWYPKAKDEYDAFIKSLPPEIAVPSLTLALGMVQSNQPQPESNNDQFLSPEEQAVGGSGGG